MSPFALFLHDLRIRHGLRQAELAELIGYEQSYISALEVGLKGPPTDELVERLTKVTNLSEIEKQEMRAAVQASQRKLVIDSDAPTDIYWLLNDLRREVSRLTASQVRVIREVIAMRSAMSETREPIRRLKRRSKEETAM